MLSLSFGWMKVRDNYVVSFVWMDEGGDNKVIPLLTPFKTGDKNGM